ncbi:hypothetical protein GUJ93_ZPchr0012g19003 [Zizania palustris]|uniref:Uncharacterized protein n=1 Tax=Zizania palustris TaxID=103762 RepID=A0A8J6BTD5_ZIZPA|nr:hypothetical protein GUJ93_ZPchr0012g19003 [Zizania palustris]
MTILYSEVTTVQLIAQVGPCAGRGAGGHGGVKCITGAWWCAVHRGGAMVHHGGTARVRRHGAWARRRDGMVRGCGGTAQQRDVRASRRSGKVAQGCEDAMCGCEGAGQVRRDSVGVQRCSTWVLGCHIGTVARCVGMWV